MKSMLGYNMEKNKITIDSEQSFLPPMLNLVNKIVELGCKVVECDKVFDSDDLTINDYLEKHFDCRNDKVLVLFKVKNDDKINWCGVSEKIVSLSASKPEEILWDYVSIMQDRDSND